MILYGAGANHTAEEAEALVARRMLGRCDSTGRTFDVGRVEVVQRYADCSVFRCPACKGTHDDRPAWSGPSNRRMGYSVVEPPRSDGWGALWV